MDSYPQGRGYYKKEAYTVLKFEIESETLTATIEAMRDLQERYELEAAALARTPRSARRPTGWPWNGWRRRGPPVACLISLLDYEGDKCRK